MQCIPVTFGDVVPDDSLGFSICSGDTIIQKLATEFKPKRVFFISDVDGLFTSNPALDNSAELITTLTQSSFSSACTSENINPDVTGGIYQKAKIGEIKNFTGITAPYEPPLNPDIKLKTNEMKIEDAVEPIIDLMTRKKIINFK